MNPGKRFEQDFKNSIPDNILLYRLHDSAQAFGITEGLRFSSKNPFDYLMFDCDNRNLYALELKTIIGKSISFERSKDDHGIIHYHQITGLNNWSKYPGVICGLIIEFRSIDKVIFLSIAEFNKLISNINKKSFSFSDLEKYNIGYITIGSKKLRTHYRYDLGLFIEETKSISQ